MKYSTVFFLVQAHVFEFYDFISFITFSCHYLCGYSRFTLTFKEQWNVCFPYSIWCFSPFSLRPHKSTNILKMIDILHILVQWNPKKKYFFSASIKEMSSSQIQLCTWKQYFTFLYSICIDFCFPYRYHIFNIYNFLAKILFCVYSYLKNFILVFFNVSYLWVVSWEISARTK